MKTEMINALIVQTGAVLNAHSPFHADPGQPYAREAPLTPYEFSAAIGLDLDGEHRLEFLLSAPAVVLDALADIEEPDLDARAAALAQRAHAIVDRARSACGVRGTVEVPRIVVGTDVHLPWLSAAGRRLCMPWSTEVGGFVVESSISSPPAPASRA